MASPVDLSVYVRAPQVNVPTAVALGVALLQVPPINHTERMTRARRALREAVVGLQHQWAERDKKRASREPLDPRMSDRRVDAAWRAVHQMLQALASLPEEASERFAKARELLPTLFPEGRGFLALPYPSEWAESEKRLQRIADEGMEKDLETLLGADVLQELRAAHEQYGHAVRQVMHEPDDKLGSELTDALRKLFTAIRSYGIQVIATVDDDDPATLDKALEALRPVDILRGKQASGGASEGEPTNEDLPLVTPDSEVPEVG